MDSHLIRMQNAKKYPWIIYSLLAFFGVVAAILFVLVITRHIHLIDAASTDTLGLLQAVFSAQIAILALVATALGLVVQLRATRFGGNVLFNVARDLAITLGATGMVISILLDVALLGNWRVLSTVASGLIPDIAIFLAMIFTFILGISAARTMPKLMNDDYIVSHIASMTRRRKWRKEIRESQDAPPLRWLLDGLIGAEATGDIRLFSRLLRTWVSQILNGVPYSLLFECSDDSQSFGLREPRGIELSGEDADYILRLDEAHCAMFLDLSHGVTPPKDFMQELEQLCKLSFPAFSARREYHLRSWLPEGPVVPVTYQRAIPGLITLGQMTTDWIKYEYYDLAAILIRNYWGPAGAATLALTEQLVDLDDYATWKRTLPESMRLILRQYIEDASESGRSSIKHSVSAALLQMVVVAKSKTILTDFLRMIEPRPSEGGDSLEDIFGEELNYPWMLEILSKIAKKKDAPGYELSRIAANTVEFSADVANRFRLQWVKDEILLFLHEMVRAFYRNTEYGVSEDLIVRILWKFLEYNYTPGAEPSLLGPDPFDFVFLEEGAFYKNFKERYKLTLEVLSDKGKTELIALRDDFLKRRKRAQQRQSDASKKRG